jgi:hypothetical protein
VAKSADTIEVNIPANKRFTVVVDGRKQPGSATSQLSKKKGIIVKLMAGEENEYEIILGNQVSEISSVDFGGNSAFEQGNDGFDF